MMDAETVREWIAAAEAEVVELTAEAEKLQFRLAEKRRQLMLLCEVLASLTNSPVAISASQMGIGTSTRGRVQAAVEMILQEYGRPMRIQDIHAEFIRRGVPLPGRGTPTNIAAHLVDKSRFHRFGRGAYGLAEWDRQSSAVTASGPVNGDEDTGVRPDSAVATRPARVRSG